MKRLLWSCALSLLAAGCSSSPATVRPLTSVYSPAELRADVARMRSALKEGHPALTKYRTAHEVDSIFKSLDDSAAVPRTALSFWKTLAIAVAGFRDDHTSVVPNQPVFDAVYKDAGSLPLRLGVIGDRLYVISNYLNDSGPPSGSEILTVNGESAAHFLNVCKSVVPTDGELALRAARKVERDFELTCAVAHGIPQVYKFGIHTPTGESRTVDVKAVPWRTRRVVVRATIPRDTTVPPQGSLTFHDNSSIAVLSLPDGFRKSDEFNPAEFIEQSFAKISASPAQQLIIDVRGNTGGTDRFAGALFAHIAQDTFTYYTQRNVNKKHFDFLKGTDDWMLNYAFILRFRWFRKKPGGGYTLHLDLDKPMKPRPGAFTGPVYLLVDGNSVSTSSEFASVFKTRNRGTIIGEESGSASTGGTGSDVSVVLPNSGLIVNVPLITAFIAPRRGTSDSPRRGVMPDVAIAPNLADVLARRDPVLTRALELARGKAH